MKKISIYELTNMSTIIIVGEFSINYEMTIPKSCHDMTTPMEMLAVSFELLYLPNIISS